MPRPKFDVYKKKVKITKPKKSTGKTSTFYKLLSKTTMRVPKDTIRSLPRINAAVTGGGGPNRIPREIVGGIILHYDPKDLTFGKPLNDPADFGSPSHVSLAFDRDRIAHAVPSGVKTDSLKVIHNCFQYCILFTLTRYVPHRNEIMRKAIDYAKKFTTRYDRLKQGTTNQYEAASLGYNWSVANSLHFGIFLKSIGLGKLSRAWSSYGTKARGRMLGQKAAVARITQLKKSISSANVEIRRKGRSWDEDLKKKKNDDLEALKAELMSYTSPMKLICSQMVLLCYEMALDEEAGNLILPVDPRWGTPAQVERELAYNKFWKPRLIIEPIGFAA